MNADQNPTASSNSLDYHALEKRMDDIQARYNIWVAPIQKARAEKLRRVNIDGYSFQDFQREMAEVEQQQAGKDNPYEDSVRLLDELCQYYLNTTPDQRRFIRSSVRQKQYWAEVAPFGYMKRIGERLRAGEGMDALRLGLAAASIENCKMDSRDTLLALADLYVSAEQAGIDPGPAFAAVAQLSSDEKPSGGTTPMKEILGNFHTYAVLQERRQQG